VGEGIEETKRKTLYIAGTLTSVCMSFPTLSALVAGYEVFAIIDASGNWSKMATDLTLARVVQAGVMPIETYAVLMRRRAPDVGNEQPRWSRCVPGHAPHYRCGEGKKAMLGDALRRSALPRGARHVP